MQTRNVAEARSGECEAGRIGEGRPDAGRGDDPIPQGLAQRLQRVAAELGQLAQEEDPAVGEAHLPWAGGHCRR
jgi:hypothetical protein